MKSLSIRLLAAALLAPAATAAASDWPGFRGPKGDGVAPASDPPLAWSETENVAWRTAIHGKGWSSPVVAGGEVWLTTATEDGHELFVLTLDAATGAVKRDLRLYEATQPALWRRYNSYASPTPLVADGRVYVTFGEAGTACLDARTAKVIWERRDLRCNHYRGAGSSPILHAGRLFLNFDGADDQFVVALDAATGKTAWQRRRSIDHKDLGPDGKPEAEGDLRKAFATCTVGEFDGVMHLVSQGAKAVYGYDPATGAELWRVEERTSHSGGTRPVIGHGLVYLPSGWSQGQTLAIRPGKAGEVLDANDPGSSDGRLAVAWKSKRGTPKKPSLTLVGGLLFGLEDGGVAHCWDAKSGELLWSERLGGNYSASPVAAAGRLYCFSQDGPAAVIATDRTFAKLAENRLAEGCMASPAVDGDALLVRTSGHLYRIARAAK
jgi:outer membrane protein assembly factor BamB